VKGHHPVTSTCAQMSVEFHAPAVLFPGEEPTFPIGWDCGWATACIQSFVGLKTQYPLTNHRSKDAVPTDKSQV
jgi:hypothetical protein